MYKTFETLHDLCGEMAADKCRTGAGGSLRDRYPLRFVLFENFADFHAFVDECNRHSVFVESMERWMDGGADDQLITYSRLADNFQRFVRSLPAHDYVIAPFSEVARFYDNDKYSEFDALVRTMRLTEAPQEAQRQHQRVYVPVIGMQGKMGKYRGDPSIFVWECKSERAGASYQLVLTRGTTYGVRNLACKYTVCQTMRQWVSLWKMDGEVSARIICASKAVFDNAGHARPDNAFTYVVCGNAFDFLSKGLGMDFGDVVPDEGDMAFWERLAADVDAVDFCFDDYVCRRFNVAGLDGDVAFAQAWLDSGDSYSRWLLKTYYLLRSPGQTYLGHVLRKCRAESSSELFSLAATEIFGGSPADGWTGERLRLLREAARHNVAITEAAEEKVRAKLASLAADPARGCHYAMRYMSPLTLSERRLMVKWLGEGRIQRDEVKTLFPALYDYTATFRLQLGERREWVNSYFCQYRRSKVADMPTAELGAMLDDKNGDGVKFETWYGMFKTVKTVLHNREDIDVVYWIDGLGVDWVPFIVKAIEGHGVDGVFLNEVYVCAALLPSTTAANRPQLEELSPGGLRKIGDLDTRAHSSMPWPDHLLDELDIVRKAVDTVLSKYNGKKIAFVSDHGLTYMARHGRGLALPGIVADHSGRCAVWQGGGVPADDKYVVAEDGRTLCSLRHDSLSAKTCSGLGAHGGALPEEVLVPVVVVSSQKNASACSAELLESDVYSTSPVVRYAIRGLSSIDSPVVLYNGIEYAMHQTGGGVFESERLGLVGTATRVTLKIGEYSRTDSITVHTGVEEDDLF